MGRLGQAPGIDNLLPAESDLAEMSLAQVENGSGRADADGGLEALGDGAVGVGRDLLRQNDIEQRGESRRPAARRRRPDVGERAGEIGILAGERA